MSFITRRREAFRRFQEKRKMQSTMKQQTAALGRKSEIQEINRDIAKQQSISKSRSDLLSARARQRQSITESKATIRRLKAERFAGSRTGRVLSATGRGLSTAGRVTGRSIQAARRSSVARGTVYAASRPRRARRRAPRRRPRVTRAKQRRKRRKSRDIFEF